MRPVRIVTGLLLAAAPAAAQLSPGPLSQAHARLEGTTNCLKCHQTGEGVAAAKCLDCHRALRARIAARRGLHAGAAFRARCESCHIEHYGRKFRLIDWGKEGQARFDHRRTGYALQGAHARQACRACHRPAFVRGRQALAAGGANLQRTFLGLSPACLSCHRDEHRGQVAANGCLSCHTMAGWRPPAKFDHARTDFPLTGRHQAVACASCHQAKSDALAADPDRKFLVFAGVAHQSCASCHRDPHQGRFGPTCAQCHSTAGWRQGARAAFDHGRTGFPLTGRHRAVACGSCHKGRDRGGAVVFGRMAHARCTDCHRDPHAGRFGTTCTQCHSTANPWRQASVGRDFDHDQTRFPLRGGHRRVACDACHRPGQPRRGLKFERCADCHRDPHAGQFAARSGGAACEGCHRVEGFSPSTFTAAAHQRSRFPLEGAHRAVPCIACHRAVAVRELPAAVLERLPAGERRSQARVVQFRFASTTCAACHGDPHQGQFARASPALGCQQCHAPESWRRVAFDHDRHSRFKLVGAHRDLACSACHRTETRDGKPFVRFKPLPVTCEGCHGGETRRGG